MLTIFVERVTGVPLPFTDCVTLSRFQWDCYIVLAKIFLLKELLKWLPCGNLGGRMEMERNMVFSCIFHRLYASLCIFAVTPNLFTSAHMTRPMRFNREGFVYTPWFSQRSMESIAMGV